MIERTVSAAAWGAFPGLLTAIERWGDLAESAEGLVISAVDTNSHFVYVRVSAEGPDGEPIDWREWLIPLSFRGANQSAIDHFAQRNLIATVRELRRAIGSGDPSRVPTVGPGVPAPDFGEESSEDTRMAKNPPAPAPAPDPKGKPGPKPKAAPAPAAAKARSKPGPKPKAAPAPAAAKARSKPGPKPKAAGKK